MRALLLTRSPQAHGNRRLAEAAAARGWQLPVVDSLAPLVVASTGEVLLEGEPLAGIEAVLPRFGPELQAAGLVVLRALEAKGARNLASAEAFARARDKVAALARFLDAGLPVPESAVVADPAHAEEAVARAGGAAVVVKPALGWCGKGSELFEEPDEALRFLRREADARWPLIVQRHVREAEAASLRAIVVDGELVAAARFRAADGDFRANASAGSSAEAAELDEATAETACAAVACLGLRAGGVDLLPTPDGALLLEVNAAPGFRAVEEATEVDVADRFLAALEAE